METFYKHVKNSSEFGAKKFEEKWLHECCEVVENLRDAIEDWMPQDSQVCNGSTLYLHLRTP